VLDPGPFGGRLVGASGTVNVGSSVGIFETMSLEDEAGVGIDGVVACSVVDEAPAISRGDGDRCDIRSATDPDKGAGSAKPG
jgi:hypothetical protein